MNAYPRRAGQPQIEPFTLAQALTHLRETADGGANDAYISSLIAVARQTCEDRTERTLLSTPWLLKLSGFPAVVSLRAPPVIAVQSVSYLDESGTLQTLAPADYVVDTASEPGCLVPAPGKAWPATQAGAINAVEVAYTAGYGDTAATVPQPLRQWILLALGDMYANREASGAQPQVGHQFADRLLDPYLIFG